MNEKDDTRDESRQLAAAMAGLPPTLRISPPSASVSVPSNKAAASDVEETEVTTTDGAKLKMPSRQAASLTRAYNKLLLLHKDAAAGIVVDPAVKKKMVDDFETELATLQRLVEAIHPGNELQAKAKAEWVAKNLEEKTNYAQQLKADQLVAHAIERKASSVVSRASKASSRARAREAVLQLRKAQEEQLEKKRREIEEQRLARERRAEELRRQEEERQLQALQRQNDLDLQIEEARIEAETLESEEEMELASRGGNEEAGLPPLNQPTREWLIQAHEQASDPQLQRHAAELAPPGPHDHLFQHVLLAQAKLPIFRGNQMEFLWFWKSFETQVEAITGDYARRLHLLVQHLEGEPHTLIKACQLASDPEVGYTRARALLQERYGNPVRQSLAMEGELMSWPSVKSSKELTRFTVQLKLCDELKNVRGALTELDSGAALLKLAAKLNTKMQVAWQMKACDIERSHLRSASFHDFVQFVERQEAARNHPVFGKLDVDKKDKDQKARTLLTATENTEKMTHKMSEEHDEVSAQTVLATQRGSQLEAGQPKPNAFEPPCLLCQEKHATAKCTAELSLDEKRARLRGICFACLKPGHTARTCRWRAKCEHCQGWHPTILHPKEETDKSAAVKQETPAERNLMITSCTRFAVATVPVQLSCPSGSTVEVRAVLDPGSTATFISRRITAMLGIEATPSALELTTMTNNEAVQVGVIQGLTVTGQNLAESLKINVAYEVEKLPFEDGEGLSKDDVRRWPHLQDIPMEWSSAPIGVLIGLNVPKAIRPQAVVHGLDSEPFAIRTALGWSIQGPTNATEAKDNDTFKAAACWTRAKCIETELQRMYYADFEGAYNFSRKGLSQADKAWLRDAEASISRCPQSGHYTVNLPLQKDSKFLVDNQQQAKCRLSSLQRKFLANPKFQEDYTIFVQKMIDMNHVEEVPEEAQHGVLKQADAVVNYVPHHGVYHPKKPGKIRVVFNCASRFRGRSLNDCLSAGPDLTNSLVGVLIRFRQGKVAFMADIEAMFYQVLVPQFQRDALRFLWWPGGDVEEPARVYRMRVHLFGAASSPAIASFALRQAAKDALNEGMENVDNDVVDTVNTNFYVDDCLKSCDSERQAQKTARGLIAACKFGGFRLTKFISSSPDLLRSLPTEELAKNLANVDLSNNKADPLGALQERALGVMWSVAQDCFRFKLDDTARQGPVTKRTILAALSSVYDPLGMAAPVIIVARILFRELTRGALGWDAEVNDAVWEQWARELPQLQQVSVPRWFAGQMSSCWELHTFCDASLEAYAAVVYLRQVEGKDTKSLSFVFGKARVSPPKVVTVPRLELTAAKLAAETASLVAEELQYPIEKKYYWSDSETVLKYLRNKTKRFHTFVANRVNAIADLSETNDWHYVPSEMNPADEATRGLKASELRHSRWLTGPAFLWTNVWPHRPKSLLTELDTMDPEVRHEAKVAATCIRTKEEEKPLTRILNHFSTLSKVKRATAVWLRVIEALRFKTTVQCAPITVDEMQRAEELHVRHCQSEEWPELVAILRSNGQLPKGSPLYKLSPKVDSYGTVVMASRTRAELPIVPKGRLADLLIQNAHMQAAHFGRQATGARVLETHWVIGLGQSVRRAVKGCPACQRRHARTATAQMAPLHQNRLRPRPPFECTGVDYFGPFPCKRGRATIKMYGAIFTCPVSRAVHLEAAESLNINSFIQALRRFVCRRGNVKLMQSDNGTNFKGANNALKQELAAEIANLMQHDRELVTDLRERGVQWTFNPPGASHFGGIWERLIRSVRRAFEALRPHVLTQEAFLTLLCECEAVLNSRPLTIVSDDANDFEALTPNHLLIGRPAPRPPPGDYKQTADQLRHQWKLVQHLSEQFWRRWTKEYVNLLHLRTKWHDKTQRRVAVGDIVLVVNPILERAKWKLGRVEAVHPGKDGEIRSWIYELLLESFQGRFRKSAFSRLPVLLPHEDTSRGEVSPR